MNLFKKNKVKKSEPNKKHKKETIVLPIFYHAEKNTFQSVLKNNKRYLLIKDPGIDEKDGQLFYVPAVNETVLIAATDVYPTVAAVFQLLRDDLDTTLADEIEQCFKAWVYSSADYSKNVNNKRLFFWNNRAEGIFNNFQVGDEPVKTCLVEITEMERALKNKYSQFSGIAGQERKANYEQEINRRLKDEVISYVDLNCFSFFKFIFKDDESYILKLIKVLNYIYFKQLRKQESEADLGLRTGITTALAKENLDALNARMPTRLESMTATAAERLEYSSNICDFYVWKLHLFNFISQLFLQRKLYSDKDNKYRGVDNLQHLVNDNQLLFNDLKAQLSKNVRYLKDEFTHIDEYAWELLALIKNYSLNNNIYYDWYAYYLISYRDSTIYVNNEKVVLSGFAYLAFLTSLLILATKKMYWNAFAVLKYCAVFDFKTLEEILEKINGVRDYKTSEELVKISNLSSYLSEKFIPFFETVYNYLNVNTLNRFYAAIDEFALHYTTRDEFLTWKENLENEE